MLTTLHQPPTERAIPVERAFPLASTEGALHSFTDEYRNVRHKNVSK